MKLHFYKCDICGKIVTILSDTGVPTDCCGQPMRELIPGEEDGASEKHVPVFSIEGGMVKVKVGSLAHPMTAEHGIRWVGLGTAHGFQFRELCPGDPPEAVFFIDPADTVKEVYAYCNLHGLWRAACGEM